MAIGDIELSWDQGEGTEDEYVVHREDSATSDLSVSREWLASPTSANDIASNTDNSLIYTFNNSGVEALNGSDGSTAWSLPLNGRAMSGATDGSYVYFSEDDPNRTPEWAVKKVDASTGDNEEILFEPGGRAYLTHNSGSLYVNQLGTLYKVDSGSGDVQWSTTTVNGVQVEYGNGSVFVSGSGNKVRSHDPSDGSEVWTRSSVSNGYITGIIFSNGYLFITSQNSPGDEHYNYRVDSSTGDTIWGGDVYGEAGVFVINDVAYVLVGNTGTHIPYLPDNADGVVATHDLSNGDFLEYTSTSDFGFTYLLLNDSTVMFSNIDGTTKNTISDSTLIPISEKQGSAASFPDQFTKIATVNDATTYLDTDVPGDGAWEYALQARYFEGQSGESGVSDAVFTEVTASE